MRHTNYLLKPVTIDNAKSRDKAYALTDGGGLLLEVLPSGTKTWRFVEALLQPPEPNALLKRAAMAYRSTGG
jgi:hypothetical protein